jgi:outer membrane protein assembly factor BamD (BamD/ComL family)
MKNTVSLIVASIILIFSCKTPSKEKLIQEITQSENELFRYNQDELSFDSAKAEKLINNYERFAANHKDDTMAAEYLFRAADLYRYLNKPLHSLKIYDRIINEFASSPRAPYSLFLKGFLYENELNDLSKAREIYHAFLEKYPNHQLSDDVSFSLKNLGKSPEELIRLFEEKGDSVPQ